MHSPSKMFVTLTVAAAAAARGALATSHTATDGWESSWSNAGTLLTPRSDMGVAVWPPAGSAKGKAYVSGGCIANQPCPQMYFDQAAGAMKANQSMQYVYCSCPSVGANFEVYDPATQKSTSLPALPSGKRYRHATVAIAGRVYVYGGWRPAASAGGYESIATEVDVFDIATNKWLANNPGLAWSEATGDLGGFAIGNSIFAVGGYMVNYTAVSTLYALDLQASSPSWTLASAAMPTARGDVCAAAAMGDAYVFGGWSFAPCLHAVDVLESFDPRAKTWSKRPSAVVGTGDGACASVGSTVYLIGGERTNTPDGKPDCKAVSSPADAVNHVLAYSPDTKQYTSLTPLSFDRFRFAAAAVGPGLGSLFVFGGQGDLVLPAGGGPPEQVLTSKIEMLRHAPPAAPAPALADTKDNTMLVVVLVVVGLLAVLLAGGAMLLNGKLQAANELNEKLTAQVGAGDNADPSTRP